MNQMQNSSVTPPGLPEAVGLYDPRNEHDSCGVGFVAHIKGKASHAIVQDALTMLRHMDHRGACGCESNTGDGAGILTVLPDALLREVAKADLGLDLPPAGEYAAGNVYLPRDEHQRAEVKRVFEGVAEEFGGRVLGWRKLPQDADAADVGPTARSTEPWMEQVFVESRELASGEWRVEEQSVNGNGRHGSDPATRNPQLANSELNFDRTLFLIRKRATHLIRGRTDLEQAGWFYVCSLSSRVIVYKGQLTSGQVLPYFPDLKDERYVSHLAMVHSRFSTNTFPSWDRAQPLRFMSHNGEINTVRGNANWLTAREGLMHSPLFGEGELHKAMPIIEPDLSDSGTLDNCLELLLLAGRELPEAVMMMIPEAWEQHESMGPGKRAFYEYHANLMEPWDGPASISFTDGRVIGAVLDRNGLRPSRYYVTDDDRVIMASEVGVLDVDPATIVTKGRLQPGRMFLVDFEQGRIVPDEEIKAKVAGTRPYGQWLAECRTQVGDLERGSGAERLRGSEKEGDDNAPDVRTQPLSPSAPQPLLPTLRAFGYTLEHLDMLMLPMVLKGQEAIGSMGNDAALAVLSDKPRLLYDYFKQLFAQVTNPPIDPIREEVIMSLQTAIGPEGNVLETTPEQCRRLLLPTPILTDEELATIRGLENESVQGWRACAIDTTFGKGEVASSELRVAHATSSSTRHSQLANSQLLQTALDRICDLASQAIADGCDLIVLTDRTTGPDRVPVPTLLAVGAVHHHLIRTHERTKIGIVVETGEAREVHHFALLCGYGTDAINPYLAFAALKSLRDRGVLDSEMTDDKIVGSYIKAIGKGLLKVMSKMGISTLASYKGAQIFEAIGLGPAVIDRCFTGTASRLAGVGFDVLAAEAVRRHELGFPQQGESVSRRLNTLPNPGEYHWRSEGESHSFSPQSIAALQAASRTNSRHAYDQYAKLCNEDARHRCTLRGLLRVKGLRGEGAEGLREEQKLEGTTYEKSEHRDTGGSSPQPLSPSAPLPLSEVEPAAEIVKRFRTGAMSLGALSKEAHESLAVAMNRIGGMSNSGEGGEDPDRFRILQNGDSKRSAIKQVASGRFGVTSFYLANADALQIKIAQGAKPGEGGQLPGFKVDEYIAKIRHSTPGVGLISPPPHHDIYSIEDLAQLIYDLKNANPAARISVKLVSEVGVGTVAAGVAKAHADHILISGHDGGTGASPLTSIKHAGLPWELGLAEVHQTLVLNDLRSRVRLETDGGFKTGRDVVIAACLGAEEFGFSTAPLISVGCIMMRKCHLNTCPVGVCTQDPVLRAKFRGTPEHVINFLFLVAEEARELMAKMGVRTIDELVGRTDLLAPDDAIRHWKTDGLDLTPILKPATGPRPDVKVIKCIDQDHGLDTVLDRALIEKCEPALNREESIALELPIANLDRAVGTMLSHEVSRRHGGDGLPDGSIHLKFRGSAGQSFGAWLAAGITLELEGDANDYVGKGLSGGRIIVYPPRTSHPDFEPSENIIAGNVCLYGATSGECYVRGIAAERFAVRNSGVRAVVEGIGDHGCEYMTGGRVVVLGPTGRNFAAGMSGGIAYVYDPDDVFSLHCNRGMVDLEGVDADDAAELRELLQNHHRHTASDVAARILGDFDAELKRFVKVMPIDYRRVLQQRKAAAMQEAGPLGLG